MKKVILSIIILIFLTGCGGLYNLSNFILPNDSEFLALIQELDTPEKICQYMLDNFGVEEHPYKTLTPYQLYKNKAGDCSDFSLFAVFVANYHGYETYQILIIFYPHVFGYTIGHTIGIFKEGDCYSTSEGRFYIGGPGRCKETFREVVDFNYPEDWWKSYIVYDYDMNIVEQGYNN